MQPTDEAFFDVLTGSYRRLIGRPLLPAGLVTDDPIRWLYQDAPFCVLAHDTEADPRFIYANRAAQICFDYSLDELIGLPSRLSAEPVNQAERQRLLDQVARQGFATNYSGIRIAKTGRRFRIADGTVWQLLDDAGNLHGQAAMFARWQDV